MSAIRYLLCLFLLTPTLRAEPIDLLLAAEGKALLPIVISVKASETTKSVAKELAGYLGRITGTTFAIETGDGTRGIVLGTLDEFPNPSLQPSLAVRKVYDGKEAFAIRSERSRLLLLGATDLGASHAAFRFLETLGCRWFFPAEAWEVVPTRKNLNVRIEEIDRPRILARRIWYGYGSFNDKGHPRGSTCGKDYEAWARHNRMASSFRVHTGHAWQGIILANKKIFEAHPEYLALVDGKRRGEQLCVSNPDLRKLAIDWALTQCEKYPEREMISMECSDGAGHCECEECKKLGTHSNQVFFLANEAAKAIGKKYPGKMVGCLAYSQHSQPPSFPLEPNVYVQLTAGFIRGPYSWDQLMELWPTKCSKMGFYEYFSVYLWDFDKLPGGRGANIPFIQERVQRYMKAGATSIDAESGNNWGPHGRGYYIANKLMWNPDADVPALLDDFHTQAFGKGAGAMRRFYERWSPDREPLLSRGLIGELFRDVEEAARVTADRPDIQARLDHIKHYLRFNHLRWMLDHEKDKAKQKELSVEILTHAYRTRYEYMNHWTAIMTSFAGDAAKKFDEPTWVRGGKGTKIYQNDTPISKDETDTWFRAGLDYFTPTPVHEVAFENRDLVPITLPESNPALKPAGMVQQFQGPRLHAVVSLKGEPIELEILPGVIKGYRDRPDAVCKLSDASGKIVASETLKLDGEKHRIVLKVPAKGTYYFECHDSGSGWRLASDLEQPVSLLPRRGQLLNHLGQVHRLFFYVPKGTKEIQYFWKGTPHKVLGPDSKVLQEVKVSAEVVTIPVPPGMDGQSWSFSPAGINQLWLFNAPNSFAASPGALLLPRTLAEKDGITRK